MPFIEVSGESIHYQRSGGGGPALLLIHGSGGSLHHWPNSLRKCRRCDVVAVDLPGHGGSGGAGRSRVRRYADVVSDTIDALGLADVAVAGHSLGGAIALTLGLRRPDWLGRLVLVGTGARLRVSPEILALGDTDFSAAVEEIGRWAFGDDPPPGLVKTFCRGLYQTGPEVVLGDYLACDRFDVMDRLDRIRCSSLVLSADQDKLTPVKYGIYLRDHIPGAELEVIEGAGHMMALEQEAQFVRAVLRFVLPNPGSEETTG